MIFGTEKNYVMTIGDVRLLDYRQLIRSGNPTCPRSPDFWPRDGHDHEPGLHVIDPMLAFFCSHRTLCRIFLSGWSATPKELHITEFQPEMLFSHY